MNAIYNFQFVDTDSIQFDYQNRSFLYGDGVFETMVFKNGNVRFLKDHLKRIRKGMMALSIENGNLLNIDYFYKNIMILLKQNQLLEEARIKLQIWRKPGGLYLPEDNKFEMLLTVKPLGPTPYIKKTAGFSEQVTLAHSILSRHKTCNGLQYVLASIEKEKRELDELILLDNNGNIAECISSNIFWKKQNTFYTPSLETGCIAGVMRKNVIKILKGNGFAVKKVKAKKKSILEADTLFSSNANGLSIIEKLEDKKFNTELEKCLLVLQ